MHRIVALTRLAIALFMLAAVGRLMLNAFTEGTFFFWDFFGYFTIQNNLIGAGALIAGALASWRGQPSTPVLELVRVCAAVYLAIVVTVYWTMLAPLEDDVTTWTNLVLHGVSGVALVLDWLLVGPRRPLAWRDLWVVLLYPAAWIAVTLVRGATDGWVPYPFLEPSLGYASIAVVVAGIVLAGLAVGAVGFRATRWRLVETESAVSA